MQSNSNPTNKNESDENDPGPLTTWNGFDPKLDILTLSALSSQLNYTNNRLQTPPNDTSPNSFECAGKYGLDHDKTIDSNCKNIDFHPFSPLTSNTMMSTNLEDIIRAKLLNHDEATHANKHHKEKSKENGKIYGTLINKECGSNGYDSQSTAKNSQNNYTHLNTDSFHLKKILNDSTSYAGVANGLQFQANGYKQRKVRDKVSNLTELHTRTADEMDNALAKGYGVNTFVRSSHLESSGHETPKTSYDYHQRCYPSFSNGIPFNENNNFSSNYSRTTKNRSGEFLRILLEKENIINANHPDATANVLTCGDKFSNIDYSKGYEFSKGQNSSLQNHFDSLFKSECVFNGETFTKQNGMPSEVISTQCKVFNDNNYNTANGLECSPRFYASKKVEYREMNANNVDIQAQNGYNGLDICQNNRFNKFVENTSQADSIDRERKPFSKCIKDKTEGYDFTRVSFPGLRKNYLINGNHYSKTMVPNTMTNGHPIGYDNDSYLPQALNGNTVLPNSDSAPNTRESPSHYELKNVLVKPDVGAKEGEESKSNHDNKNNEILRVRAY
ncbi:putative uncharacterized protein DDB_G0282499 [Gordionus sp. m RMFG-2023]|uniref:putative uncharacterized protein DDB_G0282499 n=1 Tax=Gordionus sp. m RMFG-2023 TaxID=3053472 RepID=UPI0031FCBE93